MAGDLTDAAPTTPATSEPARESRLVLHRRRFLVLYALVGGAAVVGVLGFFLLLGRGPLSTSEPPWSAWKPHGGGLGAAKEIADHVGSGYRLPSGNQLVDVIAKAPSVSPAAQQIPIHYVAVRGAKGASDSIFPVDSSNSLMFSLCGLGRSCAIATGKASVERGTLVRREILELALYTFKYVGGVNNVIAFMPPALGNQPLYAVYLQKSDLSQELRLPLQRTLGPNVPLPSTISPREQQTIDSVLGSRVYRFSLSQAQQGDAILVLAPFKA